MDSGPEPPGLAGFVTPVLDLPALVLLGVAAALYALGVVRLRRGGRRWPAARTASFGLGLLAVAAALVSGLARYEQVLFTAHAAQHMLLGVVAPPLLALGAPVALALRASRAGTRSVLRDLLRSRVARLFARPAVAWVLFVAGPFALYFTPLYAVSLRSGWVHLLVHTHFLVAGCLYAWTVLGIDPLPHRPAHGTRLLLAAVALPLHAIVGVALLTSHRLIAPDAPRPPWAGESAVDAGALADQRAGGGLMWALGEFVGVLVLGAALAQWMRADERQAAREDRAADSAAA